MKVVRFCSIILLLLTGGTASAFESSFFDDKTYFESLPFLYDSSVVNSITTNRKEFISQASQQLEAKNNIEAIIFVSALLNIGELKNKIISLDTNSINIFIVKSLYLHLVFNSEEGYGKLKEELTDTTYYSDTYSTVVLTVMSYDSYFFNIFVNKVNGDALGGETFQEAQTWLLYLLDKDKAKYKAFKNSLKGSKYKYSFIKQYNKYRKQLLPFEKKVYKRLMPSIK